MLKETISNNWTPDERLLVIDAICKKTHEKLNAFPQEISKNGIINTMEVIGVIATKPAQRIEFIRGHIFFVFVGE